MLKKKRIIPIIAGLAIIIIIATIIIPIIANKSNSAKIVTSSQLEKAVNISDLSTAELYTTELLKNIRMTILRKKNTTLNMMPP